MSNASDSYESPSSDDEKSTSSSLAANDKAKKLKSKKPPSKLSAAPSDGSTASAIKPVVNAGLSSSDYGSWVPAKPSFDYPTYAGAEFVARSMAQSAALIRHFAARVATGDRTAAADLQAVLVGADLYKVGFAKPTVDWKARDLAIALQDAKELEKRSKEIESAVTASLNADTSGMAVSENVAREALYTGGMTQLFAARVARDNLIKASAPKPKSKANIELINSPHQAAIKATLQWLDRDAYGATQPMTLQATYQAVSVQPQLYDGKPTSSVQLYDYLCNTKPTERAAAFSALGSAIMSPVITAVMQRAKQGGFIDGPVYLDIIGVPSN